MIRDVRLFKPHRDSATYQKNLISKSSNYLIAASDQITVAPDQRIIRDNTQSDLVGDQENLSLMMTGGTGQFFGQGGDLIFTDFLLLLFSLVHQVIDPEGEAINEDNGSSWGALQLFGKAEGDFGDLPAQTFSILLMPADAFVHFRVDAGAGGDEKARGVDLLGLLLGKELISLPVLIKQRTAFPFKSFDHLF
jgi:hypothetical protein